jgi:hypothetical protein
MPLTARFDALCPACGGTINAGTAIEQRRDLSTSATRTFVHATCVDRQLSASHVSRFKQLLEMPRPTARGVCMHVGVTVTRDKRYLEHVEVCYRGATAGVDDARWETAVALTRGVKAPAAGADAPAAPAIDAEEVRRIAREAAREIVAQSQGPREIVVRVENREPVKLKGLAHRAFERLLKMVAAGVNVWLAGPAGSGKTTAAEMVAEALGLPFMFNGAIDTEYKLSGFVDAHGRVVSTAFRKAYTEGGVYLFDEVDASLPGATLAFNAALAGSKCDFPGETAPVARHPDFRCIAAGNTWGHGATVEYVGRNKLDAAFLDRFVQLTWDYDEDLERAMIPADEASQAWCATVQKLRARARSRGLKVVISPRASVNGSKLIAGGLSTAEALEACVYAKLSAADRANLERN